MSLQKTLVRTAKAPRKKSLPHPNPSYGQKNNKRNYVLSHLDAMCNLLLQQRDLRAAHTEVEKFLPTPKLHK
jgi:hypothetical protein